MSIYSATITLILVMDPLGNVPVFISILSKVEAARRSKIILRESIFAFLILLVFLLCGKVILKGMGISEPALGIAGGIILFLIALKMIFPEHSKDGQERYSGEPFFVPLAIPLVAGPSAISTVTLLASQHHHLIWENVIALMLASGSVTLVLLFANRLRKVLGPKGLLAIERLMGMVLTTVAVQMFLNGIKLYMHLPVA